MSNYIITIGRQLGSGGAMAGRALADYFGFQYIDKEILVKASERLNIAEDNLKKIEEKSTSIWSILAHTAAYEVPYVADEWFVPTSSQLFKTQTEIMKELVEAGPCVIVGRCSPYIFKDYDKHMSVFLQADDEARMARLKQKLGDEMDEKQMRKLMEKEDKDRAKYFNFYTGKKWLDLREYDMSINTSRLEDQQVVDMIIDCYTSLYPELKK